MNLSQSTIKTSNKMMCFKFILLSLMLSGQSVLGYSTILPKSQQRPMIEFIQDETHHIIPTITQQSMDDPLEVKPSKRVKYDLGANKNKPLSHLRSSTNQLAFTPSHNHDNNHGITQYLVEHHGERPMMSRDDWLRYIDQQRQHHHVEVPQQPKKVVPSVKLTRFTDDSVMKICDHNNNVPGNYNDYQLYACAQQNIGRNFDLNTPWIDVMIRHEQLQNKTKKNATERINQQQGQVKHAQ